MKSALIGLRLMIWLTPVTKVNGQIEGKGSSILRVWGANSILDRLDWSNFRMKTEGQMLSNRIHITSKMNDRKGETMFAKESFWHY